MHLLGFFNCPSTSENHLPYHTQFLTLGNRVRVPRWLQDSPIDLRGLPSRSPGPLSQLCAHGSDFPGCTFLRQAGVRITTCDTSSHLSCEPSLTESTSPATSFTGTVLVNTQRTWHFKSRTRHSKGQATQAWGCPSQTDLRSRLLLSARHHCRGRMAPAGLDTLCFHYLAGKWDLVPGESTAPPDLIF